MKYLFIIVISSILFGCGGGDGSKHAEPANEEDLNQNVVEQNQPSNKE